MQRFRIGVRGGNDLLLGTDDKIGIQWLYEHHRNGIDTDNCHFDTYRHEDYPDVADEANEGCIPKHTLITALKNKRPNEALNIIGLTGYDASLKVNAQEEGTGWTALHYAIYNHAQPGIRAEDKADYFTVIDRLITYAGINVKENNGQTPLHFAARLNQQSIVIKLLAKNGVQILVQDNDSNTPLHHAAMLGFQHLVETMRNDYSPYVSTKNKDGKTAFHLAAERGHTDTVRAFSNYPGGITTLSGAEDNDGNTALHLAAENGKDAVVAVILQNDKTLLNDANNRDETPLHLAAKLGHTTTVTALLQQTGISVNLQDDQGNTPLHLAAMNNKPDVVKQKRYRHHYYQQQQQDRTR